MPHVTPSHGPVSTLFAIGLCLLPLLSGVARSQTLDELGLPSPVVVERVFPYVVFGSSLVEFQTDIVVINSTLNDAYVEFELFDPRGRRPALRLDTTETLFRGYYALTVPPGTVRQLEFSPRSHTPLGEGHLIGPVFTGWGVLKSNQAIQVVQEIRTLDPGSGQVHFEAQLEGLARSAASTLLLFRSNTGLSLVNASQTRDLTVQVQAFRAVSRSDPNSNLMLLESKN